MSVRAVAIVAAVCAGLLICGSGAAIAARGPLSAPTGTSGGLRELHSLRLSFSVPSSFGMYETTNGTPVDGGFLKQVTVGQRDCHIVLRVRGSVQRSQPSSLTKQHFAITSSGVNHGRHWALGEHSGVWLASSWRRATPAATRYGHYVNVTATVSSDPHDDTTCDMAIAGERTAAQKIAQSWVIARVA